MNEFNYSKAFIERVRSDGGKCERCSRPIISKSTLCLKCRTTECKVCKRVTRTPIRGMCKPCNDRARRQEVREGL